MADEYDDTDFTHSGQGVLKSWAKMLPFMTPQKRSLLVCVIFQMLSALVDVVFPLLLGYAVKHNIEPRTTEGIIPLLILAAAMMLFQGACCKIFVANGFRAELGIAKLLKDRLFFNLQTLSLDYYNRTPVGFMLARTNSDTNRIGDIISWDLMDFVWSVFYIVGVVIAMFAVNVPLALIVIATVPLLALLTWFFQGKILNTNRQVRRLNSRMTGAMNEGITGARTAKVLTAEERMAEDYGGITRDYRFRANHLAMLRAVFSPTMLFLASAATAVILSWGGYQIIFLGADLAVLAIFIQYAGSFFDPVQNIANIITDLVSAQANVERVTGLLETEPLIKDSPAVIEKYGDAFHPRTENWEPIHGDVEFRDVTFHYPDGKENVLEHFNLHIEPGCYCAIVGETGAGKSTLVNLACRFFEPTSGQILIDGVDYRERSQGWLHANLGYVLQEPHLFSGTIA
jgi:ATP-binding cassette subfamily B protein